MPQLTVEIIPDPELGGFTARVPDIPAYGEGETEEEALTDLKEALRGYVEAFGLEDALSRVSSPAQIAASRPPTLPPVLAAVARLLRYRVNSSALQQVDWDLAELSRG